MEARFRRMDKEREEERTQEAQAVQEMLSRAQLEAQKAKDEALAARQEARSQLALSRPLSPTVPSAEEQRAHLAAQNAGASLSPTTSQTPRISLRTPPTSQTGSDTSPTQAGGSSPIPVPYPPPTPPTK